MATDYPYVNHIINTQSTGQEQQGTAGAQPTSSKSQNNSTSNPSGTPLTRKAAIAVVAVLIVIVAVYAIANSVGNKAPPITTTLSTTSINTTTTINPTTSIYYPSNTTLNPLTSSPNGTSCENFVVSQSGYNTVTKGTCYWNGGLLSVYYGSGNSGSINLSITNTRTGISLVALYSNKTCSTYTGTYNLTAGPYLIEFIDGTGKGNCGNAFVGLSNYTAPTT